MDIHLYGHPVKALLIFQLSQLLIQLPANDPRKAAEGGQSILDPATHVEDSEAQCLAPSFTMVQP